MYHFSYCDISFVPIKIFFQIVIYSIISKTCWHFLTYVFLLVSVFQFFFSCIIYRLITAANKSSASLSSSPSKSVYMLNCLSTIQSALSVYEWAANKFVAVESQVFWYFRYIIDFVCFGMSYTKSFFQWEDFFSIINNLR